MRSARGGGGCRAAGGRLSRRWRAGAGPGARFPPAARPAASPRPRAALARRPPAALTPSACSRDSVGPAQAPQTRPEMNREFLKRVSAAADELRAKAELGAKEALTMAIQEYGDDCTAAKFDVAWDQFGSKVLGCSREQFRNSLQMRLRRAKLQPTKPPTKPPTRPPTKPAQRGSARSDWIGASHSCGSHFHTPMSIFCR